MKGWGNGCAGFTSHSVLHVAVIVAILTLAVNILQIVENVKPPCSKCDSQERGSEQRGACVQQNLMFINSHRIYVHTVLRVLSLVSHGGQYRLPTSIHTLHTLFVDEAASLYIRQNNVTAECYAPCLCSLNGHTFTSCVCERQTGKLITVTPRGHTLTLYRRQCVKHACRPTHALHARTNTRCIHTETHTHKLGSLFFLSLLITQLQY